MKLLILMLILFTLPMLSMICSRNNFHSERENQRAHLRKQLDIYNSLISGDKEKLITFLQEPVIINIRYEITGETPLLIASAFGHANCVKLLIAAGAQANQEYFGKKPLTLAAQNLYYKTVKTLVESGAEISNEEWLSYSYMQVTDKQKKYHNRIVRFLLKLNKDTWFADINKRLAHE